MSCNRKPTGWPLCANRNWPCWPACAWPRASPDQAVAILDPLVQEGLGPHAPGVLSILLKSLALQAISLDGQGRHAAALEVLLKALSIAEPEGFVAVFLNEGPSHAIADCRLWNED